MDFEVDAHHHIALFRGKEIRKTLHKDEWWFVVQDVVAALTDTTDPRQYVKKLRQRDSYLNEGGVQLVPPLCVRVGVDFHHPFELRRAEYRILNPSHFEVAVG